MQQSIIQNASRVEYLPSSTPTERNTVLSSAHETCSRFIAVIADTYPNLHNIHYRLRKQGRRLTLRAKYGNRSLFAHDTDHNRAMQSFMRQCLTKLN